jgi:hypothetical protein
MMGEAGYQLYTKQHGKHVDLLGSMTNLVGELENRSFVGTYICHADRYSTRRYA